MSTFEQKKAERGNGKPKAREDNGPVNLKAERILLATCMVHNHELEALGDKIRAFHFSDPLHAQAWEAMSRLVARGKRADSSSILPQINASAPLADVTTAVYLDKLKFEALEPGQLGSNADAVVSAWEGRKLRETFAQYEGRAKSGASGLLEALHEDLNRIAGKVRPETYGPITEALDGVMAAIRARKALGGRISGISTGYPKLDELIDGLRPATLTIIGARPKQGKTAILLCILRNLCKRGIPCVFFSLEMPKDEVVKRFIAIESQVDFSRLTRGRYDDEEAIAIEDSAIEVDRWPLIIDDAGALTPSGIAYRARNAVNVDGCKAVFIDYMQRIAPEKGSKRYEEVTAISMAMADLRKTLNVPIVCPAQLNRKLVDRSDKVDFSKFRAESTRPTDGDLRDSGQIEQDADALNGGASEEVTMNCFAEITPANHDLLHNADNKPFLLVALRYRDSLGDIGREYECGFCFMLDHARFLLSAYAEPFNFIRKIDKSDTA
ncbi:MAG: DnaB-like helicase C-terminal domain-containing protein [Rhodomicrobium sp.]